MKKKLITLFTVFYIFASLTNLTGCELRQTPPQPIPYPPPRPREETQLRVQNFEGGYGRVWLDNAVKRFEKLYENYEFEPGSGKKGVDVQVTSTINGTAGSQIATSASDNEHHIFFTEDVFYYDVIRYNAGADITDIVTEQLSEYGETKSIEDKMDTSVKDFFNVDATATPTYYALPHYFTYRTFYYDVDIFDRYGFWLLADGRFAGQKPGYNASKLGATGWELSQGIDGDNGHEFDGLPATYDEFFNMCEYMLSCGVIPMHTYGSGYPLNQTIYSAWAQNEGRESFLQTFNPVGTSNRIIQSIDGNGTPTLFPENTMVDPYNVQAQLGKYQALQFAKRLAEGTESEPKYFHDFSFSPAENNIQSQYTFIISAIIGKPIAMYADGIWWENEATEAGTFADSTYLGSLPKEERRYGVLPMPFAKESMIGNKWTINSNCNLSLSFINGNIKDQNILNTAKMFLRFLHTDEELQNFSIQTSTLKPFKYTIPENKMENMTYYGKQILSLTNNPNVDIVYTYSPYLGYMQDHTYYYPGEIGFGNTDVMRYFFRNTDKTVADLFWELKAERNSAFKPPVL